MDHGSPHYCQSPNEEERKEAETLIFLSNLSRRCALVPSEEVVEVRLEEGKPVVTRSSNETMYSLDDLRQACRRLDGTSTRQGAMEGTEDGDRQQPTSSSGGDMTEE